MTKEIIKQATEAYQAQHFGEFGWQCYRFTTQNGNPVAYVKYTNPLAEYKYTISAYGNHVIAASTRSDRNKMYDIDGDPVDAILSLLNWMRSYIH